MKIVRPVAQQAALALYPVAQLGLRNNDISPFSLFARGPSHPANELTKPQKTPKVEMSARRPTLFVTGFPPDIRAKDLAHEFEKSVSPLNRAPLAVCRLPFLLDRI